MYVQSLALTRDVHGSFARQYKKELSGFRVKMRHFRTAGGHAFMFYSQFGVADQLAGTAILPP
jgi:hypothetical protein